MALRVALVGGPMYDHIEAAFEPGEVEIVAKADHPTLNRTVAAMLAAGERIDVLATHSKYAPSQAQWLTALDDLIDTSELAPMAVDLCRPLGRQWCVPRLIDVRLAWSRADRLKQPPTSWRELIESDVVFGFTGRESGAFGMFFELVVGMGGQLFNDDNQPTLDTPEAVRALEMMATLANRAPHQLPDWHYDDVDRALLAGTIDMAAAWPGGWAAIRACDLELVPSLYPAGTHRHVSYSGCHAWAIPQTCGDFVGAQALVQRLCSAPVHLIDAEAGSMCAHTTALSSVVPTNAVDRLRLELTQATIASSMITYPALARFPTIEDAGAALISTMLRERNKPAAAAHSMQRAAEAAWRS
jgi:multiple sugar transport system substrate-binding protein